VQPTVTRFWQAWHITLSNWLRDYIFFPLSRGLLKRYGSRYSTPILFASHLTTMIACGLWHGIGSGFVTWGAWHGLGLFAHSQLPALRRRFNLPVIPQAPSIVLTFCFVTLGWVFFAADLPTALRIFGRLFGVSR
jgi:alginate O-acetyltransferase complex protein AlgI